MATTKEPTSRPGDPPRGKRGPPPTTRRSRRYGKRLDFIVAPEEHDAFRRAAEREGYASLTDWIRDQARAAIGLEKDGKRDS